MAVSTWKNDTAPDRQLSLPRSDYADAFFTHCPRQLRIAAKETDSNRVVSQSGWKAITALGFRILRLARMCLGGAHLRGLTMKLTCTVQKIATLAILAIAIPCAANQQGSPDAPAPLTPEQAALVQKAAVQERRLVNNIHFHPPLAQTYIQHMRQDPELGDVPVSDDYSLGRIDFTWAFNENTYAQRTQVRGMFSGSKSFLGHLTSMFKVEFLENGFMSMIFTDLNGLTPTRYSFTFVRNEFLGEIKTSAFDVQPKPGMGPGHFIGRVWIDNETGNDAGNIVRFNGTFTGVKSALPKALSGPGKRVQYFHFDSWRANVQPGIWLPIAVYVQDLDFKGQTHLWGYGLKLPTNPNEGESVTPENGTDGSENTQDLSPLQGLRAWRGESERNVLERLAQAGLLAAPSDFDKLLETITNNILVGNNLNLPFPVHCRIMLTSRLESIAIGNTILLSRGLIDVLPQEEDFAAMLSFQLAHIILGHTIDTRYAFNIRLLFPDESTLQRIPMNHSEGENADAAKKAVELFRNSIYKDKSGNVGLFLAQVVNMQHQVPSLLTPQLGDSLLQKNGQPWLAEFQTGAPALEAKNPQQIAALPLGSRLKVDAWDGRVYQLRAAPEAVLNASDKMPLQVTPIFYKLTRYKPVQASASPSVPSTQAPR